jgi:glycosyltransferase involved in cell wall biosynthesis
MVPGLAGGLENLARSFVRELSAIDGHNAYTLLIPSQSRHDFDLRHRPNFRVTSIDSLRDLAAREWRRVTALTRARLHLPDWRTPEVRDLRWLHGLGVEIAYSFPGYIHPQLDGLRQVLVVPDIQHEYFPEFFSPAALDERRRLYTGSILRADHLSAISAFTRRTLIEKLGVDPDRVTAVPLAADPIFAPQAPDPGHDRAVLARHGVPPGKYLFFPAHTWHHKNHKTAVEALRVLRDRGVSLTLVCSGGAREAQGALDRQIAEANLNGSVRFLGYVPRADVPALYRGAAALVFPSLFEGFGMPVLEAMASGCPVVCSDTTSLPEIAGDAACLVDPRDADAIAAAVARLVGDAELRASAVLRGLRQAATFSWRRHTLENLAIIRRVHEEMRRV